MARATRQRPEVEFGERLFWILAVAYAAECVDLLEPSRRTRIDELAGGIGAGDWRERVRGDLGVEPGFVASVYRLCRGCGLGEARSLAFILGGFGCPDPEGRMAEALR